MILTFISEERHRTRILREGCDKREGGGRKGEGRALLSE